MIYFEPVTTCFLFPRLFQALDLVLHTGATAKRCSQEMQPRDAEAERRCFGLWEYEKDGAFCVAFFLLLFGILYALSNSGALGQCMRCEKATGLADKKMMDVGCCKSYHIKTQRVDRSEPKDAIK